MHAKHGAADVDNLDAGLSSDDRTDGRATEGVVPDDEFLNGHARTISNHLEDGLGNGVGSVALVCVDLDHDTLVDVGVVLRLVLACEVRVNSMSHISRHNKRVADSSEVVLLRLAAKGLRNASGHFVSHV